MNQSDQAEFLARVPLYVEQALHRGDWRVAALLQGSHAYHSHDPIYDAGLRKPQVAYRMNRLLRHGAHGDYARLLDALVNNALPSAERAGAEAWARDTYLRSFQGSLMLTSEPVACSFER